MYVCTRVYVSSVLLLKRLAILLPLSLGVIVCSRLNSSPSAVVGTSFEIRSNKKRLDYSILWLLLYSITVVYLLFGFHSMVDLLVPSRLVVYAKVIHANKLLSLPRIDDCHDRSERVSMKISAVLKTTYTNWNRMQQSLVRFFFYFPVHHWRRLFLFINELFSHFLFPFCNFSRFSIGIEECNGIFMIAGSGAVALAHLDGAGTEDAAAAMVQRVTVLSQGFPEGRIELQLVGGYSDPRNYSEELFYNILCKLPLF